MKESIIISFIIMCIGIVIGKILNNWMLTIEICGIIGSICFAIAGVLNNFLISLDSGIANDSIDKIEDKLEKKKIANLAINIGLPNIVLAIIVFFIITK